MLRRRDLRVWLCRNQIEAPHETSIYTGIAPDVCTCKDGYGGFDCRTPLCRHLQYPDEQVAACENGGVCKEKDTCECVTALSVLHEKFPNAPGGATGWQGTDCTMPICVQGYAQCINQTVAARLPLDSASTAALSLRNDVVWRRAVCTRLTD